MAIQWIAQPIIVIDHPQHKYNVNWYQNLKMKLGDESNYLTRKQLNNLSDKSRNLSSSIKWIAQLILDHHNMGFGKYTLQK